MTSLRPGIPRTVLAAVVALAAAGVVAAPAASAKVSVAFNKRLLTIQGGDGKERVRVTCDSDSNVRVNGKLVDGEEVACRKVVEINAKLGGGNDVVDFTGVNSEFGTARFSGFGAGTGAFAQLGDGDDRYIASKVAFNLVYGERGDDRAGGGERKDILIGGTGRDVLNGGAGRDVLRGKAGNDRLSGEAGADTMAGNAGDDLMIGGAGADLMGGGTGRDRLRGGPGRDVLLGGAGRDSLKGGPGKDKQVQDPK
jgi:Ca2+-binding RTX toxin-like protein